MSSRKPLPLKLSPKARQDFVDILRYTGKTWGEKQLQVYRDKIDEALHAIGQDPQLGHQRDDLPSAFLAYRVGSHVIVYRDMGTAIGIVRILHQRMSPPRHI